jgi:hypothetical protein
MSGVADQMRAAAGDLQRQDVQGAARNAAAAAQGLRRAEGQINAGSPEARQRTAGELQLEAQQIAEAQKRLAAEAARREPNAAGRGGAEPLAQEKDRLADRIDALEQAARRLGEVGPKPRAAGPRAGEEDPAARARAGADVLQREKASARMRDSARELRQPGGPQSGARSAENEQQLARALDRAAAALGGAAPNEEALAERLEQTRAMRDTLNTLEKQLREAEARESANPGVAQTTRPGRDGRTGRDGQQGSSGSGAAGELQRLRDEYARELQRTRQALGRLQSEPRNGQMMATPETHEYSQSAPGTEAFKQDHSAWETLRRDVDLAMERYEAGASRRSLQREGDRLDAGGSDRVPDAYREAIARYYRSLSRTH